MCYNLSQYINSIHQLNSGCNLPLLQHYICSVFRCSNLQRTKLSYRIVLLSGRQDKHLHNKEGTNIEESIVVMNHVSAANRERRPYALKLSTQTTYL